MRWLVGAFYLSLGAFVALVSGPAMGLLILLAGIVLILGFRPLAAGRAITGWARLWFRPRHTARAS